MHFTFTDEQMKFRDGVRRFLTDKAPISEARRLMATETGYDRDVWIEACADLGLASIQTHHAVKTPVGRVLNLAQRARTQCPW